MLMFVVSGALAAVFFWLSSSANDKQVEVRDLGSGDARADSDRFHA
jgi:hypothetical protein